MHLVGTSLLDGAAVGAILWRWRLLAAAVAVAAFAALISLIGQLDRRYTASALVMLDRPSLETLEARSGFGATDPFTVRGEVDLMWSTAVARRVVAETRLVEVEEFVPSEAPGLRDRLTGGAAGILHGARGLFGAPRGPLVDAGREVPAGAEDDPADLLFRAVVAEYQDRLAIINDGRSLAVRIAVEAGDPDRAARLANAHALAYLAIKAEGLSGSYRTALETLEREALRSVEALREAERAAARFRNESAILLEMGEVGEGGAPGADLARLREAMLDSRRAIAGLESAAQTLAEGAPAVAGLPEALRTPALSRLLEAEAEALVDLRRAEAAFGPGAGAAEDAGARLAAARAAVAEEAERVRVGLEAGAQRERRLLVSLDGLLDDELARSAAYNAALAEYRALEAEAETRRLLHEGVLRQQSGVALADGLIGAQATLVAPASPPLKPSFPRPTLLALIATMLSAGLGAGAALLANVVIGAALPAAELARRSGLPDLAEVAMGRRPEAALRDPRAWTGLRLLRARLDARTGVPRARSPFIAAAAGGGTLGGGTLGGGTPGGGTPGGGTPGGGPQAPSHRLAIALTEVGPGERRVPIAVGLAKSFAAAGHRTLLVDADRSAHASGRVLAALDAPSGLAEVLRGSMAASQAIVSGGQAHLDVLPAGGLAEGGADALGSPALPELLASLGDRYARVVILAPALRHGLGHAGGHAGEVASLGRSAGAVAVVVPRARRALRWLLEARRMMERFDLAPVGFVLVSPRGRLAWARRRGAAVDPEPPALLHALPPRVRERGPA